MLRQQRTWARLNVTEDKKKDIKNVYRRGKRKICTHKKKTYILSSKMEIVDDDEGVYLSLIHIYVYVTKTNFRKLHRLYNVDIPFSDYLYCDNTESVSREKPLAHFVSLGSSPTSCLRSATCLVFDTVTHKGNPGADKSRLLFPLSTRQY